MFLIISNSQQYNLLHVSILVPQCQSTDINLFKEMCVAMDRASLKVKIKMDNNRNRQSNLDSQNIKKKKLTKHGLQLRTHRTHTTSTYLHSALSPNNINFDMFRVSIFPFSTGFKTFKKKICITHATSVSKQFQVERKKPQLDNYTNRIDERGTRNENGCTMNDEEASIQFQYPYKINNTHN